MVGRAQLVYLDWNILSSLGRRENPVLREVLESSRGSGRIIVPFSPAHIDELENTRSNAASSADELIRKRLNFLSALTDDTYLFSCVEGRKPVLRKERPQVAWRTLTEERWATPIMHNLLNLIGKDAVDQFRRSITAHPNEINNIRPPGIVKQLEALVGPALATQAGQPSGIFTFEAFVRQAESFHPQSSTFGFEHRFVGFFTLLNLLGYWPDKVGRSGNVASFYDASHAAAAVCADVFVSEDKRLRMKTIATYEYYDVPTRVIALDEFSEWLECDA